MTNYGNSLHSNTYLISTSLKSFGFIISDNDSRSDRGRKSYNSFFEEFRFSPDVTEKIFKSLRLGNTRSIFAVDIKGNGFLFCSSANYVKLFAFVKKLDINGNAAATIIREHFKDEVMCINGDTGAISHEGYLEIYNALCCLKSSLFCNDKRISSACDIQSSVQELSTYLLKNAVRVELSEFSLGNTDGYVFSMSGFILFLSFLYMTVSKLGTRDSARLSLGGKPEASVVCADIYASKPNKKLISRLDFLCDIMDTQNLTLFYKAEENKIRIVFLPCYVDDGLYGLKAPIEPLDYLN